MKAFAGLRYIKTLEFAAGRCIHVVLDDDGRVYRADEDAWVDVGKGTRRQLIDSWQADA